MGCDIHCYIEYRGKLDGGSFSSWQAFGGSINPGRSYAAFAVLAGVRNWFTDVPGNKLPVPFPPRGMPDDASYASDGDNWLYVSDDPDFDNDTGGGTSRSSAAKWVMAGSSRYKGGDEGDAKWVSHPDWHTHSWLTPAEMRQALSGLDSVVGYEFLGHSYHIEWGAMLAAADYLSQRGEARIVFWFDN